VTPEQLKAIMRYIDARASELMAPSLPASRRKRQYEEAQMFNAFFPEEDDDGND